MSRFSYQQQKQASKSMWVMEAVSICCGSDQQGGNRAPVSAWSQSDLWTLFALLSHKSLVDTSKAGRIWYRSPLIWKHHSSLFFCLIPSSHFPLSVLTLTVLPATQMYCMTAGGWCREQQSCTYPSLCNVICRIAFVRRSTARTEARLTCVRCVRSQGQQRRHKCSGTWWSQNCLWSRIENDTSECCCGATITEQGCLLLDDDHAIYMQKRINKCVSLGLCRPSSRWIRRHSETAKALSLSQTLNTRLCSAV